MAERRKPTLVDEQMTRNLTAWEDDNDERSPYVIGFVLSAFGGAIMGAAITAIGFLAFG